MARSLGNYENFIRTKIMGDAFKDVKAFATSKHKATSIMKRRALWDMNSILTQRHEKVQRAYFYRLKLKIDDKRQRTARLKIIYGKINAQRKHDGFRKWVQRVDLMVDKDELNLTGPVTEQVFEANRQIKNLKDFMLSEGYPEE